jgi:RHS repeat-associated protein
MILGMPQFTDGITPFALEVDRGGVKKYQVKIGEEIAAIIEHSLLDYILGAAGSKRGPVFLVGKLFTQKGHGAIELQTMTGPDNVKITISTYDRNGNPLSFQATDANNNPVPVVTSLVHDALNWLRSITQNLTAQGKTLTATYDFDQYGSLTAKDPEQNANSTSGTRYDFNYNRKLKRMTDALSGITDLTYGGQNGGIDRLTKVQDLRQYARGANGKSSQFIYDKLGRLEREINPLNQIIRYTYYDNGLLKGKYDGDPGTQLVSYTYNKRGELTEKLRRNGDDGKDSFTYKANGFLDTATTRNPDNSVLISYTFDWYKNGLLKSVTDNTGRSISYDLYDNIGQRKTVTYFLGTSDQRVITYDYDTANRPWHITDNFGTPGNTTDDLTFTFGYDERGRRNTLTYPGTNPIIATYGYDDLDHLTSLTHMINGGANIVSFAYPLYDNAGNRKSKSVTTDSTTAETYIYDPLYRIFQTVTPNGTEEFHYDLAGNRTSGPGPMDTRYETDPDANLMKKGRLYDYAYDNRGNQTTRTLPNGPDKTWIQTWDGEDRLTKVVKSKGTEIRTVTFSYDPFGRRIGKTFTIMRGAATLTSNAWSYVYDNEDIALEIFAPTSGPQEKTFFIHGPGIDEPLALVRGGQYYTYHADGMGSVTAITDSTRNVVERYSYDTFGKPAQQTGFRNSYSFTGRELDKEAGLMYYRERYRDLLDGSLISKDPLGFAAGDVNLWSFTSNNPINRIDPTGLYDDDVHFGLTHQLAVDANIPPEVAYQIAKADQSVDTNFWTSPLNPITGTIFHFQTSKYAAVGLAQSLDSGDIDQLGKFLHIMQDTYSHKGFNAPLGHILSNMGTKYSYKETDRYSCINPRDIYMRKETEYWLKRFKERFIGGVK